MSDVMQPNLNPAGDFQGQLDLPLGTQDPKAACEKREQWYAKLFAEGELRSDAEKVRLEQIIAEWEAEPVLSMEEVFAQIDRTTSLDDIIADLERELEAEK